MKVLVAETDTTLANELTGWLDELGHEAIRVSDGRTAWETLQSDAFSVVIAGWSLPGLDAPELCRRIRSLWPRGYVYVIILAGREHEKDRPVAMRAGVDAFVFQPLDRLELVDRLAVAARILQMQTQLADRNDSLLAHQRELEEKNGELQAQKQHLRQAYNMAEQARSRFSQLFESLPVAGFSCDGDGTVFEWNRRAEQLFTSPSSGPRDRKIWDILGWELVGETGRQLIEQVFQGRPFEGQTWSAGDAAFRVSGHPLHSPDGAITGAIIAALDVSAERTAERRAREIEIELASATRRLHDVEDGLEEANRRLVALSTGDPLTGIPNHRSLQEQLQELLDEPRAGAGFCLAVIGIDRFQEFNDRYGHPAGNDLLMMVAQNLRAAVRESDFVARYAGGSFAVILLGASEERGLDLCERLRGSIESIERWDDPVSASFGVCECSIHFHDAAEMLAAADAALHHARGQGGGRIVAYHREQLDSEAA